MCEVLFNRSSLVALEGTELFVWMNTRVVFGVTSSLFLLYATIKYHLEEFIQDHNTTLHVCGWHHLSCQLCWGSFELYVQMPRESVVRWLQSQKVEVREPVPGAEIDAAEGLADFSWYAESTPDMRVMKPAPDVDWSPLSDSLVFDLSCLSTVVDNIQPTNWNFVTVA